MLSTLTGMEKVCWGKVMNRLYVEIASERITKNLDNMLSPTTGVSCRIFVPFRAIPIKPNPSLLQCFINSCPPTQTALPEMASPTSSGKDSFKLLNPMTRLQKTPSTGSCSSEHLFPKVRPQENPHCPSAKPLSRQGQPPTSSNQPCDFAIQFLTIHW